MLAKCIRDCWDGKTLYRINGGPKGNGVYDIDPNASYSIHFEFEDPGAQLIRNEILAAALKKKEANIKKSVEDKAEAAKAKAEAEQEALEAKEQKKAEVKENELVRERERLEKENAKLRGAKAREK